MMFLSDDDVTALVGLDEAVAAIEGAFLGLAEGRAALQPRIRTDSAAGKLSTLGGILEAEGVAGAKVYTTSPDGSFDFAVLLFDLARSQWLGALEGGALTRVRTAATSCLVAGRLARPQSEQLTVFGTGVQAAAHCLAFARRFPLRRVRVVHHRPATDFVARLRAATQLAVEQVEDPSEAVDGADLVVTATRATTPLFPGSALSSGAHVTSVGATASQHREVDEVTVARSSVVVVESAHQARGEAGNLLAALERGAFSWDRVTEVHDLVAGRVVRGDGDRDLSFFDSLGVGLEDVAVGLCALRKAEANGRGTLVPIGRDG